MRRVYLSTIFPPIFLAYSQLYRAVRAPPTCRLPVGEGANLTRTCQRTAVKMVWIGQEQHEATPSPPSISALGLHAADLAGLQSRAGCGGCNSVLAGCKRTRC